jgi:hypothetical protein
VSVVSDVRMVLQFIGTVVQSEHGDGRAEKICDLKDGFYNSTDSIMTRYDTGRTEIPFGPFDVCNWVSPFLIQDSPIKGTPLQCPNRGILAEPLN